MGTGWRRALCTSVRRDPADAGASPERPPRRSPSPSPRSCAKLSFFSSAGSGAPSHHSTPKPRASEAADPALRCRTKPSSSEATAPQCEAAPPAGLPTSRTPPPPSLAPRKGLALFQASASTPSSPRSPSRFALLKASLLSRGRCGVCGQRVKNGQGSPAVFTAECSHAFHLPCIAAHVRAHALSCPVCSASWRQPPFLASLRLPRDQEPPVQEEATEFDDNAENRYPHKRAAGGGRRHDKAAENHKPPGSKVYDDDEPLLPSKPGHGGFNPIPEADEDEAEGGADKMDDFDGFFASPAPPAAARSGYGVAVSVLPDAALVSSGRRHGKYVVVIKVKAPPVRSAAARRAPIDLVTVLDVGQGMTGEKLQMLKRAMRLVMASLGPADRLSVVAFSGAAAKRLFPLRRMSLQGQRSARQIIDRLVACPTGGGEGHSAFVGAALRKATKLLEDRRERNPVATVILLSDNRQEVKKDDNDQPEPQPQPSPRFSGTNFRRPPPATTRFAHLEIPIGDSSPARSPLMPKMEGQGPPPAPAAGVEDVLGKCLGGLVSVVMQDVRLNLAFPAGEISAVYACGAGQRAAALAATYGRGSVFVGLGDLYAEEERELLLELRAPLRPTQHHAHSLSVRCSYRDPATAEHASGAERSLLLPALRGDGPATASSLRLSNLFVATRALAESQRLAELGGDATAQHLLSTARSLLLHPRPDSNNGDATSPEIAELVGRLDTELAAVQVRRRQREQQQRSASPSLMRREATEARGSGGGDQLTPTSAWRAAEQLAKVAIMRKSLNRVGDLHGFEDARF